MFVAYFDFYLLLICFMLWLFAANKVVYILKRYSASLKRFKVGVAFEDGVR